MVRNGRPLASITAVTVLTLAVVLYFMQDADTERIVLLLGFVGPTIAALLKIAQIERNQETLNGEVVRLHAKLDEVVPKVEDAAHLVDDAAPKIVEAVDKLPDKET